MDTLTLLGGFAITGALVSIVTQFTKKYILSSNLRMVYVIALSVVGGLVVYFFHLIPTNIVNSIIGVWAAANTVYVAISRPAASRRSSSASAAARIASCGSGMTA